MIIQPFCTYKQGMIDKKIKAKIVINFYHVHRKLILGTFGWVMSFPRCEV